MLRKYIYRLLLLLLIVLLAAIYIVFGHYYKPNGIDINKFDYPITGIDISRHNKHIDWEVLKNQSIDFVFIKATEGANHKDPNYILNFSEAKIQNIPVGAYHFFKFNKDGYEQAENFKNSVKLEFLDLPPVVDVEEWGNRVTVKNVKSVQKEISRFIYSVEKVSKRKVLIYTNFDTFNKYINTTFPDNPIWICTFNKSPQINGDWLFWQHSHKGKINGISGLVDLNTFNGNRKKWKEFLKSDIK